MSLDYTKVTHESMLTDWNNRVLSDEQYKNLSQASIYSYLQEFIAGVLDLTNYYIQRTAEENYLDTAKLDSSVIKLCHNLGYQPKRPIPATANISMNLQGPLPKTLQAGDTIWLNNKTLTFRFNGHDFFLDACYSYKLTQSDINNGVGNSSWSKKIMFAVNGYTDQQEGYITLSGKINTASAAKLRNIKVVQGKVVTKELDSVTYASKVGKQYQWYDIDDLQFSNYYGIRDPFAFKNGEYEPKYGLCKVGIGRTIDEAMTDTNIFNIEDEAVELCEKIKTRELGSGPVNVACIRSNHDKTVRLYFGNGIDTVEGLTSTDDMIFVQYVITDGSDANYPDASGSVLSPEGKIYASGNGRMVNLTNNVTFMFESSIHGGTDFESRDSMIRNAKLYFASTGKLITMQDFMSYLLTIADPIVVKHAIAFGENQLEESGLEHDAGLTNLVLYTLFSDIYREYNGLYRPVNVFDEKEDLSSSCLYVDYDTYMKHLFDIVDFLLRPKRMTSDQYNDRSTFGQWCEQIRADAESRMMLNTKMISMPPLFHYYDVVGEILVDRHVDMAEFKDELENSIYAWLSRNTTFNSQIYKSDITSLILQNPSAKRVNLDIKVSELIKGETKSYRYASGELRTNQNILIVPINDDHGNDMRPIFTGMVGRDFKIKQNSNPPVIDTYRVEEVSIDPSYVYVSLGSLVTIDSNLYIDLVIEEDSLYSRGRYTGLDFNFMRVVEDWIESKSISTSTDARPIELPYTVAVDLESESGGWGGSGRGGGSQMIDIDTFVREETFKRIGANSSDINENLSEESFYYAIFRAIRDGYLEEDVAKTNFQYIYPALKVVFDDNILDDNNNIVNFSSSRDIPVIRLRFRYVYA